MSAPFIVLGKFVPSVALSPHSFWKAEVIGLEMMKFLKPWHLVPHKDPKHGPEDCASWISEALHAQVRRHNWDGPGGSFHQDGDTTAGSSMDCAMVLWSDSYPVELHATSSDTVYSPKAGEVILFRNLGAYHRRPAGVPFKRWTFRQRVAVPNHIELP